MSVPEALVADAGAVAVAGAGAGVAAAGAGAGAGAGAAAWSPSAPEREEPSMHVSKIHSLVLSIVEFIRSNEQR